MANPFRHRGSEPIPEAPRPSPSIFGDREPERSAELKAGDRAQVAVGNAKHNEEIAAYEALVKRRKEWADAEDKAILDRLAARPTI